MKISKHFFYLALTSFMALSGLHAEVKQTTKIFILAGQSNVLGEAPTKDLPEEFKKSPENVKILKAKKWAPLEASGITFGPEISFGHAIAKAWPNEKIGIIKSAAGGSSFSDWSPDWTGGVKGNLYKNLVTKVQNATEDQPFEIVAFFWGQAAADARDETLAKNRAANLEKFITALRKDLKQPNLPFIFHQVPPNVEGYKYANLVIQGNIDFSKKIPFTRMFPIERLSTNRDGLHYDAQGQIIYGRRFAEEFLSMQKEQVSPSKTHP
jgi:hypothetical protein